jgi:hypothetical protein
VLAATRDGALKIPAPMTIPTIIAIASYRRNVARGAPVFTTFVEEREVPRKPGRVVLLVDDDATILAESLSNEAMQNPINTWLAKDHLMSYTKA